MHFLCVRLLLDTMMMIRFDSFCLGGGGVVAIKHM
jgi:hypothetical protein